MAVTLIQGFIIAIILITSIAFWQSWRLRLAQKKLAEYARRQSITN